MKIIDKLGCKPSKILKSIAIIVSRFNKPVTQKLLDGALETLKLQAVDDALVQVIWVPGAVEIPLIAKKLAESGRYSGIIALGAVIRGETVHFDYVCNQVSEGVQSVMLEFNMPISFHVLMTENGAQAYDRVGGLHGHKGKEAAECLMEMLAISEVLCTKE